MEIDLEQSRSPVARGIDIDTLEAKVTNQVDELTWEPAERTLTRIAGQRTERSTVRIEQRLQLLPTIGARHGNENTLTETPSRNCRLDDLDDTCPSQDLWNRERHNPLAPSLRESLVEEPALDHTLVKLDR